MPQDNKRSLPRYPKAYRSLIRSGSELPRKAPQIQTAHNLKKENKNRSKSKSNDLELLRCPHPPSRFIINVKLQRQWTGPDLNRGVSQTKQRRRMPCYQHTGGVEERGYSDAIIESQTGFVIKLSFPHNVRLPHVRSGTAQAKNQSNSSIYRLNC